MDRRAIYVRSRGEESGKLTVLPDVASDALRLARGLAEHLPDLAEHLPQVLPGTCRNPNPQNPQPSAERQTAVQNKNSSSREKGVRTQS